MKIYIKHFLIICKHKWYVAIECFKRGLYWQGIIHDLSKLGFTEFFTSARYFQGNSSPIKKEKYLMLLHPDTRKRFEYLLNELIN